MIKKQIVPEKPSNIGKTSLDYFKDEGNFILNLNSTEGYCQLKFRQQMIAAESTESVGVFDVNGDKADPVYKFLKGEKPGLLGSEAIKWNFTKFLVNPQGEVVKRYAPTDSPEKIQSDIQAKL